VHLELVALDGAVQVGVDLEGRDRPPVGRFVEQLDAVPAASLRAVEREILARPLSSRSQTSGKWGQPS